MTTPAPSPSPGLWPRATAQAFTPFADPKVLHLPCPTSGAGRSPFSWVSLLCVWHPPGGRGSTKLPWWPWRGLRHRFQVWVLVPIHLPPPTPHPSQIRPAVASETCSIFNPFLELALFFKEPGPVPCCPHSTPAPREERVNIYFYLFAFCVGMGLCPVPGGPM